MKGLCLILSLRLLTLKVAEMDGRKPARKKETPPQVVDTLGTLEPSSQLEKNV